MSIELTEYARLRPYLYHLTSAENLSRIRRTRALVSAASLAEQANRQDLLRTRRKEHVPVVVDGDIVVLRDQAPLHRGNMRLDDGWTFERFVKHVNGRVFFWPGDADGPIPYGERHFGRYAPENPVILRVVFSSVVAANPAASPLFSRCNSGSPRWSRGLPGNRGAMTFVEAAKAPFRAAQAVEVTFLDKVNLPHDSEYRFYANESWKSL